MAPNLDDPYDSDFSNYSIDISKFTPDDFNRDIEDTLKSAPDTAAPSTTAPSATAQSASTQSSSLPPQPRQFHKPKGTMMAKPGSEEVKLAAQRGVDYEEPPKGETGFQSIDPQGCVWYFFYPHDEVTGYVNGDPVTGEPLPFHGETTVEELRSQVQEFYDTIPNDTEHQAKKKLFRDFLEIYKTAKNFRPVTWSERFSELRNS